MKPFFNLIILFTCFLFCSCQTNQKTGNNDWIFVSIPDFLNVDCDYPQEGWEDALSYILNSVKQENQGVYLWLM